MTGHLTDADRERFERLRSRVPSRERQNRDAPEAAAAPEPLDPMLAEPFEGVLDTVDESAWIAERKFDGTRIILEQFEDEVQLFTRRHVERSDTLSELAGSAEVDLPSGIILDGEYCYLTPRGRSRFVPIHRSKSAIEAENLTGHYFIFDILAHDGRWCTRRSLLERKKLLRSVVADGTHWTIVPHVSEDFQTFYDDLVERGEEGIMLKRRTSLYHRGTRSVHWRKVKAFSEHDVIVLGYTQGEGARADTFGALVMSDGTGYIGRVGSGFEQSELTMLADSMTPVDSYPVAPSDVDRPYTPVEPFVISVRYQDIHHGEKLRAPVFVRERPEKPVEDVEPVDRDLPS